MSAMIIRSLGAELRHVLIDDFDRDTHIYSAKLTLRSAFRDVLVDVRPSDALTLALLLGCPIFVANEVLKEQ